MNNQWDNGQFGQGMHSQAGQVTMFDPKQFQTPPRMSGDQPGKLAPQQLGHQSPGFVPPVQQQGTNEQAAHSSWNSWGTWDWGVENKPVPKDSLQQEPEVQQPYAFAAQNPHEYSKDSAPGARYFGGGHGGDSTWNQGWNGGADLYSQSQQILTGGDANASFSQGQQPHHSYGGEEFNQGQDGAAEAGTQQHIESQQLQQQYFPQFYDHHHQEHSYNSQSKDQQQYIGQAQPFYEHSYNNQSKDQEQFVGQAQPFYDHSYNPNAWATASENGQYANDFQGQHQQVVEEGAPTSSQQLNSSQSTSTENTPSASSSSSSNHGNILIGPSLQVYSNEGDDDGTVSDFFSRDGDGDGDVQLESKKPPYGGGAGNESNASSGYNQFLTVASNLQRSNSEISNASLSTLNLSSGEEDDGQEQLHNVQKLVQRMEELNVAQREGEVENLSRDNSLTANRTFGLPSLNTEPYSNTGSGFNVSVYPNDSVSQQEQFRGDYSGFSSSTYFHNNSQLNIPQEGCMRPATPEMSQPSSSEPGLGDWEFVPPQAGIVSHNGSNILDNNVGSLDRPDGDVGVSYGAKFPDHQGKPARYSEPQDSSDAASDQNAAFGFHNPDHSHHSSLSNLTDPGLTNSHHEIRERSGSPYVAAYTDNRQEEMVTQASFQATSTVPPSKTPSTTSLNQQAGDRVAETQRRENARSAVQSSVADLTNQPYSLTSKTQQTEDTKSRNNLEPQRPLAGAGHVSKNRPSAEDGNCGSERGSNQSINSVDSSPRKNKDKGESPLRSSSRNSEEISTTSGQQRQHHSAFHPVSRPRRTMVSPATTLWDNADKPTPNILLAPAMPLIIPSLKQFPSSANETAATKASEADVAGELQGNEKNLGRSRKGHNSSSDLSTNSKYKGDAQSSGERRGKGDKNRSFDSLDEIDAIAEGQRNRSYRYQRNDAQGSQYSHSSDRLDPNRQDSDRASSRNDRPNSRSDRPSSRSDQPSSRSDRPSSRSDHSGPYQYDRPSSRTDGYSRDDPYRKPRGYYRDYADSSFDERYDRPRSRNDESHGSRPSSRSTQEVDQPRSRTNYERDYYYRDRYRGYNYDGYDRTADYYSDARERYYRYYKDKETRYNRGYYEEYYGVKLADYQYKQQQQQQQQKKERERRLSSQGSDHSSSQGPSRVSTPATAPSPGIPAQSRATPGSGPDYYGNRGSRPSSRMDYSHDYYNRGYVYDGYGAYYDGYGYDPYTYGYGYPTYDEYNRAYYQGRMTPPKYSYPHVRACFGPGGQLIKVLPNRPADGQPAVVEVQDVQVVLEACPEAEELKDFPGPLSRENTHKKDVLLFCQKKALACSEDVNMVDRESAQLIWKYLELLIKQNGSVVGTDLSDLLLEGHEPSTHNYGMKISQSPESLDTVPEGNNEESSSTRASPAIRVTSDRTLISSSDGEREKWVDRFRHLLLYGRRKDALECAMKHDLWGHALFLASKMDTRTHANVMTRFANGAIRMNDPLQTLYQLMSGRQPAAVTGVVDERWGDWRPHLAMILSNQTSRQDVERKSITVLGDTLAAKGCLHASHFCYLMAQVSFGSYLKKTSKIVLIGSSHNLPLEEFATNDAIQCTEIYEYAQTLRNPEFCLPSFQVFKYLYACRLTDYGMASEALQYCEVIAINIKQYPSWFHAPFVKLVFQLSSRLKYSDPQRQISGEDGEDPAWLQQLEKICTAYDDGSIQPLSGTATPAGVHGTTVSSESGDYSSYGYGYSGDASSTPAMSATPALDAYARQQYGQVDATDSHGGVDAGVISGHVQNIQMTSTDQYQQQQQQAYSQQEQYDYAQWQQQQQQYGYQQQVLEQTTMQQQQQQQGLYQQTTTAEFAGTAPGLGTSRSIGGHSQPTDAAALLGGGRDAHIVAGHVPNVGGDATGHGHNIGYRAFSDDASYLGGSQLDSSSTSTNLSSQFISQNLSNYETDQTNMSQRGSISTAGTDDVEDEDDDVNSEEDDDQANGPSHGFDYFGSAGAQRVVVPPHRYRNTSGSSGGSLGRRRRTLSGSSTGSVKAAPPKPSPPQNHQQATIGGRRSDRLAKSGPQDNGGSGWFGGFLNKFKGKGKNEMILPDDKNPSIVWDPVKKKWMNADGTEEEATPTAPPPRDVDLIGKPSESAPAPVGLPPSVGNLTGNRFSLKAKGARSQYVDVNNPKPVSMPPSLFNVMPDPTSNTSAAAPQLFMPGSGTAPKATTDANNSNSNSSLLKVPESSDQPHQDTSSTSLSATAAPSLPVMFNPANLKSEMAGIGQPPAPASGPSSKFGQRRAYPPQ